MQLPAIDYHTPTPDAAPKERVLVSVAWPYSNGPRHIGHGAALVPADVLARYFRSKGADVLMVSGTDEYGTPNIIAAEKAGESTRDFVDKTSAVIRKDFIDLGMSFDWFTRTTGPVHEENVKYFFACLAEAGYVRKGVMLASYDSVTGAALPDRYIEGTCPKCGATDARGDQCDNCGSILDPNDLIGPKSTRTGNPIEFRDAEHYFIHLEELKDEVLRYLADGVQLRKEAKNMSENIAKDLRARAITREISWGIPLPDAYQIAGQERVLYVWFEAVIGYLSASIEWAIDAGKPEAWKAWWGQGSAKSYYVMGKDNIPFHTIIWPAMLTAKNAAKGQDLQLAKPDVIVSTANLNFGNAKFSTSRGNVAYIRDLISLVGPDTLRYYLLAAGPESKDSNFTLEDVVTRSNDELLAKWGNLVSRTAALLGKNFPDATPAVSDCALGAADEALLAAIREAFAVVGASIEEAKFAQALRQAMVLLDQVNKYVDDTKPWEQFKTDPVAGKTTLAVLVAAIENVATILHPFIPHSSYRCREMFTGEAASFKVVAKQGIGGFEVITNEGATDFRWEYAETWGGNKTPQNPEHLIKKLDAEVVVAAFAELRK